MNTQSIVSVRVWHAGSYQLLRRKKGNIFFHGSVNKSFSHLRGLDSQAHSKAFPTRDLAYHQKAEHLYQELRWDSNERFAASFPSFLMVPDQTKRLLNVSMTDFGNVQSLMYNLIPKSAFDLLILRILVLSTVSCPPLCNACYRASILCHTKFPPAPFRDQLWCGPERQFGTRSLCCL